MARETHGERLLRSTAQHGRRAGKLTLTDHCLRWETSGDLFWRDNVPSVHVSLRDIKTLTLSPAGMTNVLAAELPGGEVLDFGLKSGQPLILSRDLANANEWLRAKLEDAHSSLSATRPPACDTLEGAIRDKAPQPVWHWLSWLTFFFVALYAGISVTDYYGPLSTEWFGFVAAVLFLGLMRRIVLPRVRARLSQQRTLGQV